jgi:hypothetical protein
MEWLLSAQEATVPHTTGNDHHFFLVRQSSSHSLPHKIKEENDETRYQNEQARHGNGV